MTWQFQLLLLAACLAIAAFVVWATSDKTPPENKP